MKEFTRLNNIVKLLRSKDGCPWDRAQKLKNYKTYLLEEVYELLEALNSKKHEKIKEELGDVFLLLISIGNIFEKKEAAYFSNFLPFHW